MLLVGKVQAVPSTEPGRGYLGWISTQPIELPYGTKGRAAYYQLRILADTKIPGATEVGPLKLVSDSSESQKSDSSTTQNGEPPIRPDGRSPLSPETDSALRSILSSEETGDQSGEATDETAVDTGVATIDPATGEVSTEDMTPIEQMLADEDETKMTPMEKLIKEIEDRAKGLIDPSKGIGSLINLAA